MLEERVVLMVFTLRLVSGGGSQEALSFFFHHAILTKSPSLLGLCWSLDGLLHLITCRFALDDLSLESMGHSFINVTLLGNCAVCCRDTSWKHQNMIMACFMDRGRHEKNRMQRNGFRVG